MTPFLGKEQKNRFSSLSLCSPFSARLFSLPYTPEPSSQRPGREQDLTAAGTIKRQSQGMLQRNLYLGDNRSAMSAH